MIRSTCFATILVTFSGNFATSPGAVPTEGWTGAGEAICALSESRVDARAARERLDRARVLLARGDRRVWRTVARLLEESGDLGPPCAQRTVQSLLLAARLSHAVGELATSRRLLQRVARHAVARGDVGTAAHARLDAAHVALERGEVDGARDSVDRARMLALSPSLSARQRADLLRRIEPARSLAVSDR